MNADLFLEVADAIEAHPQHFNMATWWGDDLGGVRGTPAECGTTACVAGWAATIAGFRHQPSTSRADSYGQDEALVDFATEALGLDEAEADAIFMDWASDMLPREVIVARLRGIAKGELTWRPGSYGAGGGQWLPA